jgi:hypothetical protein
LTGIIPNSFLTQNSFNQEKSTSSAIQPAEFFIASQDFKYFCFTILQ